MSNEATPRPTPRIDTVANAGKRLPGGKS